MKQTIAAMVLLVISSAALPGCGGGGPRPVTDFTATVGADSVQRVEITAHSFFFEPSRVTVKAGVPVELTLHNASLVVPHNFTCDAAKDGGFSVEADLGMLKGGATLKFTPRKAGEFHFFCDKDHHEGKGMTGTLVVTP